MASEEAPKKAVSMRHSKLTAKEAALLTGELNKPTWQSRNEGIHERVSFEDTIWGFDLAGGLFYKTPLRVTMVKTDSRAEKAGIRPGDMLLRINDIDTSTLTIQEAHEIIVESGVYLRLAVTAPDDEEDSYFCWEDQIEDGYDSEEERRKKIAEKPKKEIVYKVSSYWSLQWPWVSKRRVIYRESNCFMVNSKYESKHRDKFPLQTDFGPKVLEDIVLHSKNDENNVENPMPQTDTVSNNNKDEAKEENVKSETEKQPDNKTEVANTKELKHGVIDQDTKPVALITDQQLEEKIEPIDIGKLPAETEKTHTHKDHLVENGIDIDDEVEEEGSEDQASVLEENGIDNEDADEDNSEKKELPENIVDDDVIDQVLEKGDDVTKDEEENIINGILSESDVQNSEAIDENER